VSVKIWLFGATIVASATACSSPASRFYVLGDRTLAEAAAPVSAFRGTVVVHAAALPESVDRPQLVVSGEGQQEVVVLEQERWAEPLRAGIARFVAAQLTRLLGTTTVSTSEDVITQPDYRVSLDVRRFEAAPESAVDIEMLWRVRGPSGVHVGHKRVRETVKDKSYEGVVSADARALELITRDIAQALVTPENASPPATAAP
jgi:uncharacterized lipoprotein YmbA